MTPDLAAYGTTRRHDGAFLEDPLDCYDAIGESEPTQEREVGSAVRRLSEIHHVAQVTTHFETGPTWYSPKPGHSKKLDHLGYRGDGYLRCPLAACCTLKVDVGRWSAGNAALVSASAVASHVHSSHDYVVGSTRILANPRGYVRKEQPENPDFDPYLIIDLEETAS